ncbi:MAG: cupredoxin domain-containing protein [Microgenomates group bacterium]
MNKGLLIGTGVFIAVVILGFVFLKPPKEKVVEVNSSLGPTSTEVPTSIDSSVGSEETVKEISISATDYSFSINSIPLKVGEKVRLTFKNNGNFPHDFRVDDLDIVTKKLITGESEVVEFTPEKAGVFAFYCDVSDHQEKGMEGKLVVTQ